MASLNLPTTRHSILQTHSPVTSIVWKVAAECCWGIALTSTHHSAHCSAGLTQANPGRNLSGMSAIILKVNGQTHTLDLDPATPLLYALSDDLALRGPKFGCGLGQCGACTAIVNGTAMRSCVTPVSLVAGKEIVTLEGLGTPENPHPIQKAFIDEQAAQCGFCVNGVILTAKAFLDKNPKASEAEIQQALSTVLCRCFTHVRMREAIQRYAKEAAK